VCCANTNRCSAASRVAGPGGDDDEGDDEGDDDDADDDGGEGAGAVALLLFVDVAEATPASAVCCACSPLIHSVSSTTKTTTINIVEWLVDVEGKR